MKPVVKRAPLKIQKNTNASLPPPLEEKTSTALSAGSVLREFTQSLFAVIVLSLVFGGTWLSMQGEKVRAKFLQERAGVTLLNSDRTDKGQFFLR